MSPKTISLIGGAGAGVAVALGTKVAVGAIVAVADSAVAVGAIVVAVGGTVVGAIVVGAAVGLATSAADPLVGTGVAVSPQAASQLKLAVPPRANKALRPKKRRRLNLARPFELLVLFLVVSCGNSPLIHFSLNNFGLGCFDFANLFQTKLFY